MKVDVDKKLVFLRIVQTHPRPDTVMWSETGKRLGKPDARRITRGKRPSTQSF
ncbi:hypothetical protein DPMN_035763 [Dreissena polymorpha]|uniref:Uncharacterized protein n=1 Tax=Dreissena polymorpha TaxID=45954 RepID=A0A9D4MA75_DREPO|nr:hypothetical protein DPMN_035763 [Dreissena polymorpha]